MAASMGRSTSGLNDRTFEDYDPAVEWSHAADADTVTISLPGFRRDELRVQVDSKGHLRVRGERPVEAGSTKWIRFNKDLKLPDNCDIDGMRAKLEDKKLTIKLPKKNRPSPPGSSAPEPAPAAQKEEKSRPSPPDSSASEPAPAVQEEEGKGRPSPPGGSASAPEPAPTMQEEKKSRPTPPDGSASQPAPAVQEEEKSRPSPPGGSAPEQAPPPTQEEKNSLPSPPDASASEPAPAVQEEEESRPSLPNGFAPDQAPGTQEEKKSRPSPPDGSVREPAPKMQEEDEDENEDEEETMVEIEMADGRRPIHWILVAVAAVSFVGITAYVVWRKLRSGCAAGAGDHGPGELAGAGSYIDEM